MHSFQLTDTARKPSTFLSLVRPLLPLFRLSVFVSTQFPMVRLELLNISAPKRRKISLLSRGEWRKIQLIFGDEAARIDFQTVFINQIGGLERFADNAAQRKTKPAGSPQFPSSRRTLRRVLVFSAGHFRCSRFAERLFGSKAHESDSEKWIIAIVTRAPSYIGSSHHHPPRRQMNYRSEAAAATERANGSHSGWKWVIQSKMWAKANNTNRAFSLVGEDKSDMSAPFSPFYAIFTQIYILSGMRIAAMCGNIPLRTLHIEDASHKFRSVYLCGSAEAEAVHEASGRRSRNGELGQSKLMDFIRAAACFARCQPTYLLILDYYYDQSFVSFHRMCVRWARSADRTVAETE